jgi:hypothetical protein
VASDAQDQFPLPEQEYVHDFNTDELPSRAVIQEALRVEGTCRLQLCYKSTYPTDLVTSALQLFTKMNILIIAFREL